MKIVISKQDDTDEPQPQQNKFNMEINTIVTTAIVFTTKLWYPSINHHYQVNKMTEGSDRKTHIPCKRVYYDFRPDSYTEISSSVCHP